MSYVCAFRGRRDGYEVPLALAESGRLERFITDVFLAGPVAWLAPFMPRRLRAKLGERAKSGIPDERVTCLLGGTVMETLAMKAGASPAQTYMRFDAMYSRAAARAARRARADLFLYSPYAMPAFALDYAHKPLKVLFQFHPHAHLESAILEADRARWAAKGLQFGDRIVRDKAPGSRPDYDDGWKHADHVICASSFSRRSLTDVGAAGNRISVIPYGIAGPDEQMLQESPEPGFHVLFVGSGIQRKGLHHLLEAWRTSGLAASGATLTVVSRVIEPSLQAMAAGLPGVAIVRGASDRELSRLYAKATLFCMPSLVEGFGQVYLEALTHGLPVLGTENTCLPDLGGPQDAIYTVEPGNVEMLAQTLTQLAGTLPGSPERRASARRCASRFTWPVFRRRITSILESLEAARKPSIAHV
jgi:glycosyltransferase involved in cell wall biosynthesis